MTLQGENSPRNVDFNACFEGSFQKVFKNNLAILK